MERVKEVLSCLQVGKEWVEVKGLILLLFNVLVSLLASVIQLFRRKAIVVHSLLFIGGQCLLESRPWKSLWQAASRLLHSPSFSLPGSP